MKKVILFALAAGAVYYAQQALTSPPLPRLVPAGAQVYLEAKDFGALLREWNASNEKKQWLASANYSVFSKSRLFLKLADAQGEFAAASGLGVDSALLDQLAGGASALAVYDIGNLEFLFITKLAAAPALQAVAGQFTNRNGYYVKTDADTKRTTAFATKDGWLLLSTNENRLAAALALMANQSTASLSTEPWFQRAAQTQGELRMAANLEKLQKSPHFQSYWVQRNQLELEELEGVVADLNRSAGAWVETRTATRLQSAPAANLSLQALARAIPADAGFYRLAPGAPVLPPTASASFQETVNEEDLETLIDQAPFSITAAGAKATFENAVAHVVVRGTRVQQDQVFLAQTMGLAVLGRAAWNEANMKASLPGYTVAANGTMLYITNHEPLLRSMQAGGPVTVPNVSTVYLASFRHAAERQRLVRLLTLVERPSATPAEQPDQRVPEFFTETIGSLSQVLLRFQSASVARQDLGNKLTETVTYSLRP